MILQVLIRWTRCLTLCLCSVATTAATREVLDDLSARIQFDYYTADARALQRDLQSLKQWDATDSDAILRQYYLAYGYLKLAETLSDQEGDKDRSTARKAASECVDLTDAVTDKELTRSNSRDRARLATLYGELWAINAACDVIKTQLSLTPGGAQSGNNAREKAAFLAPNNPRVQLLSAIHVAKRAKTAEDRNVAHKKLLGVGALFDHTPPSEPGLPDWGHAEALTWIGQSYLQRGDSVAARNNLERALVIAPDYVWARTLQTKLKSAR